MSKKKLRADAIALVEKFYNDCQELFDNDGMDDALYESDLFQALLQLQIEASEIREATP